MALATLNERLAKQKSAQLRWGFRIQLTHQNKNTDLVEKEAEAFDEAKLAACREANQRNQLHWIKKPATQHPNAVTYFNELVQANATQMKLSVCVTWIEGDTTFKSVWADQESLSAKQGQHGAAESLLKQLPALKISASEHIGTPLWHFNDLVAKGEFTDVQWHSLQVNEQGEAVFEILLSVTVQSKRLLLPPDSPNTNTSAVDKHVVASKKRTSPAKRHIEQKSAFDVLKQASCFNDVVWDVFILLDPHARLRFGTPFPKDEGEDCEFKGSNDPKSPESYSSAKRHIDTSLAITACAFLNNNGGHFLVGIHDNATIQGVKLPRTDRDTIAQAVLAQMRRIKPQCLDFFNMRFREVLNTEHGDDVVVIDVMVQPPLPPRQDFTLNGTIYIRKLSSNEKRYESVAVVSETNK